jgi:peptidyl-tRNA hydrolase
MRIEDLKLRLGRARLRQQGEQGGDQEAEAMRV